MAQSRNHGCVECHAIVVAVPTGYTMLYGEKPDLAISPDGHELVYPTAGRLYLRALDRFDAQPIPGTRGCAHAVLLT